MRLVQPRYVKSYLKRGKTDAAHAAVICEAVSRPSMQSMPLKSEECDHERDPSERVGEPGIADNK